MSEDRKNNGPLDTLTDGPLFVKFWRQDGPNGPFVTATSGRIFRDEQSGDIRETSSLTRTQTLKMAALQQDAHREMGRWQDRLKENTPKRETEPGQEQSSQGLATQRDEAFSQARQAGRGSDVPNAEAPSYAPER